MRASSSESPAGYLPMLSVIAGIATFSAMDAMLKGASIAVGVFSALLLRNVFGTLITIPLWLAAGRPLPSRAVLAVHAQRSAITAMMAVLFFYGLVRVPLAEGIAISFIAPIVALYFAAVMLGEKIRPQAIAASVLGVVGVLVIGAGRFGTGTFSLETIKGTVAILCSAMFYAANLVFQRKQALLAGPVEIALFQSGIVSLIFLVFSPWFALWPDPESLRLILGGAVFATAALLFLSWGYARAEAQVLVPIEYTGFLWAALFGWLMFGEHVEPATVAGAALIVIGCWIATRMPRPQTMV
ncbi:DMT family transporter [Novosphingobium mangrovi (ex Huang et al. 2023)]|uniref:DMT family transporter n=1 Tax=Novosphingobium mangrovi (ex Huang et al. 2023) TaxID=2976432 RepID=A0ABT2I396_9SPHN|nr:DMT family transporter [Novosphingobium mangrovi (ex Huang et al. 2023)]MCT2399274.1 DMT family transporter [Novosphingobium mangrovi (ex Huang et al. 2023)]